jgi:hypothetical protein
MLQTQELLNVSNQELESHKSKRLAARSEMIGLAQVRELWASPTQVFNSYQAHEKMQADLAELRDYIRYTLLPMVFDQVSLPCHHRFFLSPPSPPSSGVALTPAQVSGVETALQHIEMVSNMILAKRMIKAAPVKSKSMASAASSAGRAAGSAVVPGSQSTEIEMNASHHSPSGLLEEDKKFPSPSSSSLNGKKKKECDGMEQALILKGELDRVLSGVKLLGDTVDRLTEIVRSDSRCCGGTFDAMWMNLLGSNSWSGVSNRVEQGGYSSVRLDESAHG